MLQELIKFKKKEVKALSRDLKIVLSNRTGYAEASNFHADVKHLTAKIYKIKKEIKGVK